MVAHEQALKGRRATPANKGVRIKTIALPAEHGGWSLLFEPIVLGLLIAPSIAGLYVCVSAMGVFLARHPLTLVISSWYRPSPRTKLAKRFAAAYLLIGAVAFAAALALADASLLLPVLIAAPLAIVQVGHDWSGRRRVLLAEIAGAIAISSVATTIALAAAWPYAEAFALWGVMICRGVPAILYVRACLDRRHGRVGSVGPVLTAHVLAIGAVCLLAWSGLAPALMVLVMVGLLLRALLGVTQYRRLSVKQLGFTEITFGVLTVFAFFAGRLFEG